MLARIVSGGQTGVDRAALDVALDWGMAIGGWCPQGRRAEDGRIPDRYSLEETRSSQYAVRTRKNVEDSDGTLILTDGDPVGGTALTVAAAEELGRPLLVLDLAMQPDPQAAAEWLRLHTIRVLNVAGPRESTSPGIGQRAAYFLTSLLEALGEGD